MFAASSVDLGEASRPARYSGGIEATGSFDLDFAAGDAFLESRPQPDHAQRLGPTEAVYLRGTSEGVGGGVRGGFFVAGTNTDWMGRIALALDGGFASYEGRPYGALGATAAVTGGFTVDKSYDPKAWWLCRSLTYLTFTLEGSYQRLPDGPEQGVDVWSAGLLVGLAALDDGGAPSDAANATTRCPR